MLNDLTIILWKESRDFRHQLLVEVVLALPFIVIVGISFPIYLADSLSDGHFYAKLFDALVFFVAVLYSILISGTGFREERDKGTLQTLLATPLWPESIVIAKWIWSMSMVAGLITILFFCESGIELTLDLCGHDLPLGGQELYESAALIFRTLAVCSFLIMSCMLSSLLFPNSVITQHSGSLLSVTCFGLLYYWQEKSLIHNWSITGKGVFLGLEGSLLSLIYVFVAMQAFRCKRIQF